MPVSSRTKVPPEELFVDDPDHPAPPYRKPPIKIEQEILYNPDLRDSDFFLPGTIGIAIMVVVLLLTANLVKEREQGTMEQLLVTPMTPFSLITGKMIPYGLIGAFDFVLVSVLAKLVFNLPFKSVLPLAVLAALFILALLMIGAFLFHHRRDASAARFLDRGLHHPLTIDVGLHLPDRGDSRMVAARRLELADDLLRRGHPRLYAEGHDNARGVAELRGAGRFRGGLYRPVPGTFQ